MRLSARFIRLRSMLLRIKVERRRQIALARRSIVGRSFSCAWQAIRKASTPW